MADKKVFDRPVEEMDNLERFASLVRLMCDELDNVMAKGASAADKRHAYLCFLRNLITFIAAHGTATYLGDVYQRAALHAAGLYVELARQDWGGSSDIFPLKKSRGRGRNLAYTLQHAAGAAAITVMLENGSSEDEAARRVSRVLEMRGFPIRQSTAHSKRTAWEAVQDMRDKIQSGKRGKHASTLYELWLIFFRISPNQFEGWLANKHTMMDGLEAEGIYQTLRDILQDPIPSPTDK